MFNNFWFIFILFIIVTTPICIFCARLGSVGGDNGALIFGLVGLIVNTIFWFIISILWVKLLNFTGYGSERSISMSRMLIFGIFVAGVIYALSFYVNPYKELYKYRPRSDIDAE